MVKEARGDVAGYGGCGDNGFWAFFAKAAFCSSVALPSGSFSSEPDALPRAFWTPRPALSRSSLGLCFPISLTPPRVGACGLVPPEIAGCWLARSVRWGHLCNCGCATLPSSLNSADDSAAWCGDDAGTSLRIGSTVLLTVTLSKHVSGCEVKGLVMRRMWCRLDEH